MTTDAHPNGKTTGPDEALRAWGLGFLDRLFAALREVLVPEYDEFGYSWLEHDFWPRFGLDPGDVPIFLRVLRQLEADADAVLDRALANTASRPCRAPSEPEGPPAVPVLAALLDAAASLPGVWGDARGPTLSNGGAPGEAERNRRKFSRLLAITLDGLYMNILHNPFDHREMAEIWWSWCPDNCENSYGI